VNWGKPKYGGVRYDLTHLDPFPMPIPRDSGVGSLTARVIFGSHVFTQKWEDTDHESMMVMDGKKRRCFCTIRYQHSIHLPGVLTRAMSGRVLFDPDRKLIVLGNPPGVLNPYAIFFNMRASKKPNYDLEIDVVSAHERPQTKAKFGMHMPTLAEIVSGGGAVPWPKRK
jgi:hypothetical protein